MIYKPILNKLIIFFIVTLCSVQMNAKEIHLRPHTFDFFSNVYKEDAENYLTLVQKLWVQEQNGGSYLWDEKKLPLKKAELMGALEVFMWDFKRRQHSDLEYYAIAYMLTGRFEPTKEQAIDTMKKNADYLCNQGLICNLNIL